MKTRTALVLSVAAVLVTGSAALAVNTRTLGNSSPGFTGTANEILLPQNATTPDLPAPVGSPAPTPVDNSSTRPAPDLTEQPGSGHVAGTDDTSQRTKDGSHEESSGHDD